MKCRSRNFKYRSALLRDFNFIHISKQRPATSLPYLKKGRHMMTHNREITKSYPTLCGKLLILSLIFNSYPKYNSISQVLQNLNPFCLFLYIMK